ncbi:hypothetical protein [Candidatus Korobacter versatilis]|uniref:hypothetical protein n=1 Tax=Candidatus Korobacter versatilis TaxID=658062 RepID=UPI0005A4B959|nr:hypothetical protein [Candidatus Koribacter versatilis]
MISLGSVVQRLKPAFLGSSVHTCGLASCGRTRFGKWRGAVTLNDVWYCSANCVEAGLLEDLASEQNRRVSLHHHRLPLGLLLLEQERISASELDAAVQYRRLHPQERIGGALQKIAGVSQTLIAQTVAAQWGCPSVTSHKMPICREAQLPYEFLHEHSTAPMYWEPRGRVLLLGFLFRLDYVAMAAIERVLRCTVKPCILTEDLFRQVMLELSERNPRNAAIFPSRFKKDHRARIVRNYVEEIGAEEIRVGTGSCYQWIRLNQPRDMDLLFALPADAEPGVEI